MSSRGQRTSFLVQGQDLVGTPLMPASVSEFREVLLSATGVRRAGHGWRASCSYPRGVDARYLSDARNGGYVGSFLRALEVRDQFYREHDLPIPPDATAVVGGHAFRVAVERSSQSYIVHWKRRVDSVVGGAEEMATAVAFDHFVELL